MDTDLEIIQRTLDYYRSLPPGANKERLRQELRELRKQVDANVLKLIASIEKK